jgi:hypothetical protein
MRPGFRFSRVSNQWSILKGTPDFGSKMSYKKALLESEQGFFVSFKI